MKGLEKELEDEEAEIEFRKKVVTYVAMIVFSSASLTREIYSYVINKIENNG